ncbi:MAG TPA: pilus assembly protein TadG-related protein, partial [Candidatus Polarisedimenticolia bacterium]|nr:pilus assembly protein TadG-related protein [Candidatus Polarisedimenticolia bacterium]
MKDWAGQEEGQALVVVGMAMLLLVTALALGIDWGYGYVARRTAQNAADAASLAAGRALATNFVPGEPFTVTQQDVWAAACRASSTNTMSGSSALHSSLGVWFSSDPATPFSEDPLSSWYGITAPSGDCAQVPPGGDDVLGNAVYVRVRVATGYRSLFGATTGQQIEVAANARVRLTGAGSTSGPVAVPLGPVGDATVGAPGIGLSGSTTAPNVAMWPLVMHYQPQDWTSPGSELVLIDWDSRSPQAQQDLSLFASFAHYSPHESVDVADAHQMISESDYTGHPVPHHGHSATSLLPSAPGACGGAPWDSFGSASLSRAVSCDIPNWFYYGF